MPSISFIVARSYPGNVIGYENRLPWHLRSDLQRFRQITTGHVIIMGRATFESIGRALPNRTNIVLSRDPRLTNQGGIYIDNETHLFWTSALENALHYADIVSICRQQSDIFVIGGQTMYTLFGELVNKIYLTQVFADVPGDAFFSKEFRRPQWRTTDERDFRRNDTGDQYDYRFSIHERRDRRNRYEFVTKFFTERLEKDSWLQTQIKLNKKRIDEYVQGHLDLGGA
jgi:dihydrofolate reductase